MPKIRETAEGIGYLLLGIAGFGFLILLALGFVHGMVWVSGKLFPLVNFLSGLGFVILIINLLPSALFKRSRNYCGIGIISVSYIWGVALWMYSTLVLYWAWGTIGMLLGFMFLGFGSAPLACIALLFQGEWSEMGSIVLSGLIVVSTRALGLWIQSKGVMDTDMAA